jgi:biopolymer transport protein ExbD
MAKKKQLFDVWVVQGDTVYKDVPYHVVADWVQQGRLLTDDRVRPAGGDTWHKIENVTNFAPYLPHAEPMRAEDVAEALEPVSLDFAWKQFEDADDDVDMIPLIDISLVLLIFFMMTTAVSAVANRVEVPGAQYPAKMDKNPKSIWVGLDKVGDGGGAVYSIGEGSKGAEPDDRNLQSQAEVLTRLDRMLRDRTEPAEVRVAAHKDVAYEAVQRLCLELEDRKRANTIAVIMAEVGDKKPGAAP